MQVGFKPFPPFGAILSQLIKANIPPSYSIYVFCGKDAWREARAMNMQSQFTLCLPPDNAPEDYQWPVSGLSLIVYDTGSISVESLHQIIITLLNQGAKQITLHSLHHNLIEIH